MKRVHTPRKRKANPLRQRGIETVGWKDTALLRTFLSDRGKIPYRRAGWDPPQVTGLTGQQQRQVATAIKNAREMALLPYGSAPTAAKKG